MTQKILITCSLHALPFCLVFPLPIGIVVIIISFALKSISIYTTRRRQVPARRNFTANIIKRILILLIKRKKVYKRNQLFFRLSLSLSAPLLSHFNWNIFFTHQMIFFLFFPYPKTKREEIIRVSQLRVASADYFWVTLSSLLGFG